jgi:hypothetical protein
LYPEITKKMIEAEVNMMMKPAFQLVKKEASQDAPVQTTRGVYPETEEGACCGILMTILSAPFDV